MSTELTTTKGNGMTAHEMALVTGDLAKLTTEERVTFYHRLCESLNLNPLTQPFAYITLSGKLTIYARKDCTDQLRSVRGVSTEIKSSVVANGLLTVTVRASLGARHDEATGVVAIDGLKGEALANACMKAETKAKRRATLSLCGLGIADESEIEVAPAVVLPVEPVTPAPREAAPSVDDEAAFTGRLILATTAEQVSAIVGDMVQHYGAGKTPATLRNAAKERLAAVKAPREPGDEG